MSQFYSSPSFRSYLSPPVVGAEIVEEAEVMIRPLIAAPGNLTISEVPVDVKEVVIAKRQDVSLSGKLKEYVKENASVLSILPASNSNAGEKTVKMPKYFIETIVDMVSQTGELLPRSREFIGMLKPLLRDAPKIVNVSRTIFTHLGMVIKEIENKEEFWNQQLAVAKLGSSTISCNDVQSVPNQDLLHSAITNTVDYLDQTFVTAYPKSRAGQIELKTAFANSLVYAPKALGLVGGVETDVKIKLDLEDLKDEQSRIDVEGSRWQEVVIGLRRMFSEKVMNQSPVELGIVTKAADGTWQIAGLEEETIPVLSVIKKVDADSFPLDISKYQDHFERRRIVAKTLRVVPVPDIVANTPIIDLDWIVTSGISNRQTVYEMFNAPESYPPYSTEKMSYYSTTDFLDTKLMETRDATVMFSGFISKRSYTALEVRALSDTLSSIWSKLRAVKLPSMDHVLKAGEIISQGLIIGGQAAGKSGWVQAGALLGTFTEGFGSIVKGFKPHPMAESPNLSQGHLIKTALTVLPEIIELGANSIQQAKRSKTNMRYKLEEQARTVEDAYRIGPIQKRELLFRVVPKPFCP